MKIAHDLERYRHDYGDVRDLEHAELTDFVWFGSSSLLMQWIEDTLKAQKGRKGRTRKPIHPFANAVLKSEAAIVEPRDAGTPNSIVLQHAIATFVDVEVIATCAIFGQLPPTPEVKVVMPPELVEVHNWLWASYSLAGIPADSWQEEATEYLLKTFWKESEQERVYFVYLTKEGTVTELCGYRAGKLPITIGAWTVGYIDRPK